MEKGAFFSDKGQYRYQLWRIWDDTKKVAMCIGLNPSTANADQDDATIRWLISSLKHLGYGGLRMVNLYGLITPKPAVLFAHPDPVGANPTYIAGAALASQEIIFCWGAFKSIEYRAKKMSELFPDAMCFGKNKNGSPWHPLAMFRKGMTPKDVTLIFYKNPVAK